jgi:hypothetical protein
MTGEQILAMARKQRTDAGLRLEWLIPDEQRVYTAFAKDEIQKQAWLRNGEAKGWVLL